MPTPRPLTITVGERVGSVSGLLLRPPTSQCLYVLAHGAGAGMNHTFMRDIASALARHHVATLRYQFPYTEQGKRRPDPPGILTATVRAAVAVAAELEPDLPLVAGGKSMGGRMTSQAMASRPIPGVRGLAFLGFPLHPAGKPGTERAAHLQQVGAPMLFLQGTRDALARIDLLREVSQALGERATLHILEGADHSFHMLKRHGRSPEDVLDELAGEVVAWARREGIL